MLSTFTGVSGCLTEFGGLLLVYAIMEDVLSGLVNLDFTLDIEDLIIEEHVSFDLVLLAHVVTERFINSDAFFSQRICVKKGELELLIEQHSSSTLGG